MRRIIHCLLIGACIVLEAREDKEPVIEAGLAQLDITPEEPIFLAGYAARRKPSEGVDIPLKAQALALRSGNQRFVFVALDNCEVSRRFMEPVLKKLAATHGLPRGSVMVVSSHTHSAPVLADTLEVMAIMPAKDKEVIRRYSKRLQSQLAEVVSLALKDLSPAQLKHGVGEATFAMNRRIYRPEGIRFGENPDGPVDWDVPVLSILSTQGELRGILFGYACHGTSVSGNGFFQVSGDYMAYARTSLENVYPGAMAIFMTGMGADQNPSPRGDIMDAKRHGVELAGAVIEVLNKPMRSVEGRLAHTYKEMDLHLEAAPDRPHLEKDAKSDDIYVRRRAEQFLAILNQGRAMPLSVPLPMSIVRIGTDLTFMNLAGEVVVDYAIRLKRQYADDHPWCIGYAYEVPCYIPNVRILKEGGYEAESSLIYYGLYGPFRTSIESNILTQVNGLMQTLETPSDALP